MTRKKQTITFQPGDAITLEHLGCIGITKYTDIQLELGDEATDYEAGHPPTGATEAWGMIGDLKKLRIALEDTEDGLKHEIEVNEKAYYQEISNLKEQISVSVGLSADKIMAQVNDLMSGDYASFEQRLDGFKTEVKKDTLTSAKTQLSDLYDSQIQALDGRISRATQTIDGFKNEIYTSSGQSRFVQLSNTFQTQITSVEGDVNRLTQQLDKFESLLESSDGDYSRIYQDLKNLSTRIQTAENNYSSLNQTVSGIRSEVFDKWGYSRITQLSNQIDAKVTKSDVESIIRSSGDNIWLAVRSKVQNEVAKADGTMTGSQIVSAINLTSSGVKISGKNVQITGDTYIQNSIIDSSKIRSLNADKITTGTLNAADVRIINLNASNITGFTSNFMQTKWNGINSSVSMTGSGLETSRAGQMTSLLNGSGHHFYHKGTLVGHIGTGQIVNRPDERGLRLSLAPYGNYMAFSYSDKPEQSVNDIGILWSKGGGSWSKGLHVQQDLIMTGGYVIETKWLRPLSYDTIRRRLQLSQYKLSGNGYTVDGIKVGYRDADGSGIAFGYNTVALVNDTNKSTVSALAMGEDSAGSWVASMAFRNRTYSGSANVHVTNAGTLGRSTSASKYKLMIEEQMRGEHAQLSHSERILDLRPKSWFDRAEAEARAEELSDPSAHFIDQHDMKRHVGLIAEDVEAVGLSEHVEYNEDGEVEGIEYDRLWIHLIPVLRDQRRRLTDLESQQRNSQHTLQLKEISERLHALERIIYEEL